MFVNIPIREFFALSSKIPIVVTTKFLTAYTVGDDYYNLLLFFFRQLIFCSLSAKPNESLKLMLVGLQKMGKTTLLSKLREVNESTTAASTFNERVKGEEKERGGGRGRKKGGEKLVKFHYPCANLYKKEVSTTSFFMCIYNKYFALHSPAIVKVFRILACPSYHLPAKI